MQLRLRFVFLLLIFFLAIHVSKGQETNKPIEYKQKVNMGIGFGLDYGGLGFRLTYLPEKSVGIFASGGINFRGIGYNFGASYRFLPYKKICPYFTMMYGYNAVIVVDGLAFSKTYYGPSAGVGLELHSKKNRENFWNFEFLIPFRTEEFYDDIDDVSAYLQDPDYFPITISVGFHFILN